MTGFRATNHHFSTKLLLLTIVVFLTAAGIVAAQPSVVIKAPDKVLIGEK
ncbi:MAG: hypothetical protein IPK58_24065, partial [Acidobacteria bacterium]|nr:hypothetical protein [Acidobacteriota bacterium]